MVLINGAESDVISVWDRGLLYGDGVFRTFRVDHGVIPHWPRQLKKLQDDCARLSLEVPEQATLQTDLENVVKASPDAVIKIVITRGASVRGYAPDPQASATRIVMASPLPRYPDAWLARGVKVRMCDIRLSQQPRLAGVKHLNRLENVLARAEWKADEYAEGLMLDIAGSVIEGTMTNVFLWSHEKLITPDLSRCGVAGVQRDRVLEFARKQGIPVAIEDITLERLLGADEVFLTNSVIGAWQVRELAGRQWNEATFFPLLRSALESDEEA